MNKSKPLSPFAKRLAANLAYSSIPDLVFVSVGLNAWTRAKRHNANQDQVAIVLPDDKPMAYTWPVKGCQIVVEWDDGPSIETLNYLLGLLIKAECKRLVSSYVGSRPETSDYFDLETGKWVDGFSRIKFFK